MKELKILVPIHTMPNIKSVTTLILENLIPVLQSHVDIRVIWFVYSPDKLDSEKLTDTGEKIVDIHDYDNAIDVLKKEKPDMIYSGASWDPINYAFSISAKIFDIPVFDLTVGTFTQRSQKTLIKSYITRFFESSVPTDTSPKKQFMRRGRFFVYKYLFLQRTQKAAGIRRKKIINDFFLLLKLYLSNYKPIFDSRFANTIHFLDNEKTLEIFLEGGFARSSLVVTGNPMYDGIFNKLSKALSPKNNDGVIRVLFAPSTLYEHGFWTREQRDFAVKEVVKKIMENKNEMSLVVKIHPSSSILSEYDSLVHSVDPSVPVHQTGDIQDFLLSSDIVISFQSSTVEEYALLARKPIIICNFFKPAPDIFLEKDIAALCANPDLLPKTIHDVMSSNPATEQKREEFIQTNMYKWDGLCSQRITDELLKLLQKQNKTN